MVQKAQNQECAPVTAESVAALQAVINKYHNQALSGEGSHVYEIWQDGEITMTKSGGGLFRQRNLHQMVWPIIEEEISIITMPMQLGPNSSAYVTREGAREIRAAMATYLGIDDAGRHMIGGD